MLVRTARPEFVRRALLLLDGSPAVLDMSDAFRMAEEGGILGGGGGVRWLGLGACRGGGGSVKSTLV